MPMYTYNHVPSLGVLDDELGDWTKIIPLWVSDDSTVIVGNFKQQGIFVYEGGDFLTEDLLDDNNSD